MFIIVVQMIKTDKPGVFSWNELNRMLLLLNPSLRLTKWMGNHVRTSFNNVNINCQYLMRLFNPPQKKTQQPTMLLILCQFLFILFSVILFTYCGNSKDPFSCTHFLDVNSKLNALSHWCIWKRKKTHC